MWRIVSARIPVNLRLNHLCEAIDSCVYQDQEEHGKWKVKRDLWLEWIMLNHIRPKVSSGLGFGKQLGAQERENCLFCSKMLTCNINFSLKRAKSQILQDKFPQKLLNGRVIYSKKLRNSVDKEHQFQIV